MKKCMIAQLMVVVVIFNWYDKSIGQNTVDLAIGSIQDNHLVVKVVLVNQDTLAGFQIPLYFETLGENIKCESISFVGTRVAQFEFLNSSIDTMTKTLYLEGTYQLNSESSVSPLLPGIGPIARLYVMLLRPFQGKGITITKGAIAKSDRDRGFLFWNTRAEEVDCSFKEFQQDYSR